MSSRYSSAQLVRPVLAILFVVLGVLFGRVDPAHACSCMEATPAQHLANADVVFEGTAVNSEAPSELSRKYTFNLARSLKGAPNNPEFVTSPRDSATCGFGFEIGVAYRVYATRNDDRSLSTGLCSGTAKITDLPPEPTTTPTTPTTKPRPTTSRPPETTTTTVGLDVAVAETTTTNDTITLAVSPNDDDSSLLVPGLVAAAGVAGAAGAGAVYIRRRRQPGL